MKKLIFITGFLILLSILFWQFSIKEFNYSAVEVEGVHEIEGKIVPKVNDSVGSFLLVNNWKKDQHLIVDIHKFKSLYAVDGSTCLFFRKHPLKCWKYLGPGEMDIDLYQSNYGPQDALIESSFAFFLTQNCAHTGDVCYLINVESGLDLSKYTDTIDLIITKEKTLNVYAANSKMEKRSLVKAFGKHIK